MNIQDNPTARSAYAIGEPVMRKEDGMLLRGEGRYTDDVNLPKQAQAFILRSTIAHGVIKSINTEAAKKMPGVLAIYTGEDMKAYGTIQSALPFKGRDGSDMKKPGKAMLPTDKVRFVGDPISCVVATSVAAAKDASEAIEVDIESLPVITTADQAIAKGAPAIYEDVPDNVSLDFHYGDTEKVAAAFAGAAHKVKLKLLNSRLVVNAMEPRAAIGSYDPAKERYTLYSVSQGVMGLKAGMVGAMKTTPDKMHIITGNVGGSFGMKAPVYPEYVCILHAAKSLGRPVKWTDERSSSFVSEQPRPRSRADGGACARRRGPFPRGADQWHRQSRRFPVPDGPAGADAEHRAQCHQPLPHAVAGGEHQMRVHQYDPARALSRRGAPRGQLLHGAADRLRRD